MNLLGVDIGGTKIAAGIVDSNTGQVIFSERMPTPAREGGPAVLARALELADRLLARCKNEGLSYPIAIGIGAGGHIDYRTGVVISATAILPGWGGTQLAPAFAEKFGLPAFADNDVNAFALGEHRFGAARGVSEAVFLTLGTGVGGAVLICGQLHRGAHGIGGELGHLILGETPQGRPLTLECLTCGDALVHYFLSTGGSERQRSELGLPPDAPLDHKHVDGYAVGVAAQHNHGGLAVYAVNKLGTRLGEGLATLANILDPEIFVIGGGLASLGNMLLEPARALLMECALPAAQNTPVLPAALGIDSSIVGAACVALSQILGDKSAR